MGDCLDVYVWRWSTFGVSSSELIINDKESVAFAEKGTGVRLMWGCAAYYPGFSSYKAFVLWP